MLKKYIVGIALIVGILCMGLVFSSTETAKVVSLSPVHLVDDTDATVLALSF